MARLPGLLVLPLFLLMSSVAAAAPAEEPFSGAIEVVLHGAIFNPPFNPAERKHVILEGEAEAGRWDRLGATALSHNNGDHYGFVQDHKVEGDTLTLRMLLVVGRDPWISGGDGTYTVKLNRRSHGPVDGTYEGTYAGQALSGRVSGRIGPMRPIRIKDYKPLDPTERPRLLFRKHDLPGLQERLKTPLGEAFLRAAKSGAQAGDIVSQGMLYQLTGDRSYALAAQKVIESYNHNLSPEGGAGSGGIGHQLVSIALAYDLCYEGFDKEFRAVLADDLDREVSFMQRSLAVAGANFHPCSNFYGPGRGAPAIASLAMFGEKGPAPKKPVAPEEIEAKGDMVAKLWAKTGQLEKYKAEYPKMVAKWQADQLAWERTGGANLAKLETFHAGFIQMNRHYRYGIGDGGYGSETGAYADIAAWYPLVYNTCHMKMFGREATFRPDVNRLMVRRTVQTLFLPGGKFSYQALGPAGGWKTDFVAAAFPALPDEYKPSVLWAWNHVSGVKESDPTTLANLFPKEGWGGKVGIHLAHTFLHYPLGMKEVHPQQGMPRNWEAPGFGWYCFRSGWDKSDDFIAQVFLKAKPIGGWNLPNAGTFRLMGLGHVWAEGNHSKEAYRNEEPVLLLPDDPVNDRLNGHPLVVDFQNGSGSLTIDMNDLYGTSKEVERKVKAPDTKPGGIVVDRRKGNDDAPELVHSALYDRNGIRSPENWADSGLTGLRAFGFDYSGKSGAPLLMVIVDKIDGGKRRDWNWPLPTDEGKNRTSVEPKATADDKSFTLDYGDAMLKATFVTPAVKIDPTAKVHIDYKRWSGKFVEYNRVSATSDSGSFFVIVTVQRKDPPAVKIEGSGLDAKVTVGGQTVRFDGRKVVFGG
jgi:hypothetical protein